MRNVRSSSFSARTSSPSSAGAGASAGLVSLAAAPGAGAAGVGAETGVCGRGGGGGRILAMNRFHPMTITRQSGRTISSRLSKGFLRREGSLAQGQALGQELGQGRNG